MDIPSIQPCEICGRNYNRKRLTVCPRCGGDKDYLLEAKPQATEEKSANEPKYERPCSSCGFSYNHVLLSACPKCSPSKDFVEAETPKVEVKPFFENRQMPLSDQAKTTHAIRAVVIILRFFLVNLFWIGIWVIFGVSQNPFWVIVMCLAWLVGAVMTFYQADKEFHKSN